MAGIYMLLAEVIVSSNTPANPSMSLLLVSQVMFSPRNFEQHLQTGGLEVSIS